MRLPRGWRPGLAFNNRSLVGNRLHAPGGNRHTRHPVAPVAYAVSQGSRNDRSVDQRRSRWLDDSAGKQLATRVADYKGSVFWLEADDECDVLLLAAHLVPWQPHAVGMAYLRFAVVVRQLLRREDILAVGPVVIGVVVGFVEGVDDEQSLHHDRRIILAFVEHQPPAEAASGGPARLSKDRVAPIGDDFIGLARLVVFLERPEAPVAAGFWDKACGQQENHGKGFHRCSFSFVDVPCVSKFAVGGLLPSMPVGTGPFSDLSWLFLRSALSLIRRIVGRRKRVVACLRLLVIKLLRRLVACAGGGLVIGRLRRISLPGLRLITGRLHCRRRRLTAPEKAPHSCTVAAPDNG